MIIVMYALLALFFVYVCFLGYLKIQSPFWFHQPVYHTSAVYPRTFGFASKPYVVKAVTRMKPNMFCDFTHIQTYPYTNLSTHQKTDMVTLLQAHVLDSETFLHDVTTKSLDCVLTGQKHQSFVSFYCLETTRETRTKYNQFALERSLSTTPIACLATHQQYVWFALPEHQCVPVYMWDYNCVHRDHKSQHLSRYMIQTHLHRQYQYVPSIPVSIFKKEVTRCEGVVPLVAYQTYTFFIQKTPISKLPLGYKIKRIDTRTMNAWVELYTQLPHLPAFEVCLMPSLNNTVQAITNETYYVILLVCTLTGQEVVKGLYVFKDVYTLWDQHPDITQKRTVQCVSSVCYEPSESLYFFRGFVHSVKELYYLKKDYGVLTIEDNSHNCMLLARWREKYPMHMQTFTGYYLYNMVYPRSSVKPHRFVAF